MMVKRPSFTNGIPGILAQAPTVVAAFGRWPGFVLVMTAILVILMLGAGRLVLVRLGLLELYAYLTS
jgi:hypothetical protein